MNSMTGFGSGSAADEQLEVAVELSSVNRRNFEAIMSLPREWQSLERGLSERLRQFINRGRVQVSLQVNKLDKGSELSWDAEAVTATLDKFAQLAAERGLPFEPDANFLFSVVSSHKQNSELPDAENAKQLLDTAFESAVKELTAMRSIEGDALAKDLAERNGELEGILNEIRKTAANVVPDYKDALMQRLKQSGLEIDLDDERVLKEIALFADRSDITEEMTRLQSHLEQFSQILAEDGAIGRKLEFLLQEVNREFNTIGSKANSLEISKCVIEAKNQIERIREQLQNVE